MKNFNKNQSLNDKIIYVEFNNDDHAFNTFYNNTYGKENYLISNTNNKGYTYRLSVSNNHSFEYIINAFFENMNNDDNVCFGNIFEYIKNNINHDEESAIFERDLFGYMVYFSVIDNPETENKEIFISICNAE